MLDSSSPPTAPALPSVVTKHRINYAGLLLSLVALILVFATPAMLGGLLAANAGPQPVTPAADPALTGMVDHLVYLVQVLATFVAVVVVFVSFRGTTVRVEVSDWDLALQLAREEVEWLDRLPGRLAEQAVLRRLNGDQDPLQPANHTKGVEQ